MNPELSAGSEPTRTELASSDAVVVELVAYRDREVESVLADPDTKNETTVRQIPDTAPPTPADIITFPSRVDFQSVTERQATLHPQSPVEPHPQAAGIAPSLKTTAGRTNLRELSLGRNAA